MSVHSVSHLQLNMLKRILKDYRGITTRPKFLLKASHTKRAATPRSINNVALLIKGVLVIYTGKNLTDISLEKYYTTSFISFLSSFVGQLHLVLHFVFLFMHVAPLKTKTGMRHALSVL